MTILRKALPCDMIGYWLNHCISRERFIPDVFFPGFALNPFMHPHLIDQVQCTYCKEFLLQSWSTC